MDDRFVLLLDILGFKRLIASQTLGEIASKIELMLSASDEWASGGSGRDFDTIHFSDTVLIFTQKSGSYREWFDDLVYIGSRLCTAMLAERIPVRGALSYGSFLVRKSGRHQVFLGQALVDAHEAEYGGDFLGFKITAPTWRRMYPAPTASTGLREMGIGIRQEDNSLLVNFLTEFRGLDKLEIAREIEHQCEYPHEEGNPWLQPELRTLRFIVEQAEPCVPGRSARVSSKYTNTDQFLREVLGERLYTIATLLAAEVGGKP